MHLLGSGYPFIGADTRSKVMRLVTAAQKCTVGVHTTFERAQPITQPGECACVSTVSVDWCSRLRARFKATRGCSFCTRLITQDGSDRERESYCLCAYGNSLELWHDGGCVTNLPPTPLCALYPPNLATPYRGHQVFCTYLFVVEVPLNIKMWRLRFNLIVSHLGKHPCLRHLLTKLREKSCWHPNPLLQLIKAFFKHFFCKS